jgi:RNA binding exosome subunit
MPPTKIQAEPPNTAGPTPHTEQQPETAEKEAGMAQAVLVQRAVADALPPPNGTPPAVRAGDLLAAPLTGPGGPGRARMSIAMQRSVGNARVNRLLGPEHAAPMSSATSMPAQELSGTPPLIQRQAVGSPPDAAVPVSPLPPSVTGALQSNGGQPLTPAARRPMEQSFGADFSGVRVHTGTQAARAAKDINATAFTHGQEIFFDEGQFQPGTAAGDKLLAHELTHTLQQGESSGVQAKSLEGAVVSQPSDADEQQAEKTAEQVSTGAAYGAPADQERFPALVIGQTDKASSGSVIQRQPKTAPKAAQAKATYGIKKKNGSYTYTFNSKDLLESGDPWTLVNRRHFRNIFPTAPAGAEEKVFSRISDKRFSIGDSDVKVDVKEEAKKADTLDIRITTELHKTMLSEMKYLYPTVPSAVPVEATHGLHEGESGQTSPTSTPQAAAPAQPETVESVKGQSIHIPANLKPEDKEKILRALNEILVAPDPNQKPDKQPSELFISPRGAELLLQIANDPALLTRLKSAGPAKGDGPSFEESLEIAIADEAMAQARKRLGLDEPTGSRREEPIVHRPVHGQIKNLTGLLVPTQEARFTFEVLDDRDAFRVPMISIHWAAYPKGEPGKLVDDEVTKYIPVRSQGLLNDRIFNVTFDKPGEYDIEALVHHNFFEPASFILPNGVRVVTETALAKELNEEELKGFAGEGTTTPHMYKIGGQQGLQMGTETRGKLDPKATILKIEDRLKTMTEDEERVKEILKSFGGKEGSAANKEVIKWAKNYLERIEESKGKLKKDKGGVPLGVRGVFVSRETNVPTKSLSLLCYYFPKSGSYLLVLQDFTQLFEPEDYRFEASDKTVEKAEEKAFLKQADAYPFGTLSVTFQAFDETTHTPTDQFVRFEKITDTPEKRFKAFFFGTTADIAVNLFAAILMVIPGLQVLGIALAIGYNTAKTVSELEDAANKGTLTSGKVGIGLAQIALNILPLAGRGAKLLTIGGKTFYVMEAVNVAGNILLVTVEGMNEVDKLRNGVIKELALVDEKIRRLERTNQADPTLPGLKKQRDGLIKQGEDATVNVFTTMLGTQAMMMVGQHLIIGYMSRKFSVGQLQSQGAFRHEKDAKARYDFKEGVIVGDELKVSPAELDRLQLQHGQNKALEGVVADPAQRQKVVEAFGERPVEVQTGAAKTGLKQEGGKTVLEVADGASPADILSEAQKARDLPTPPPEQKKPPPEPPAKGKAKAEEGKAAPEDTFKPIEPPPKEVVVEKEPAAKPPADAKAREAHAEAAPSLEAQAKAAYQEAKKKGYGGKYTEEQFIEKYKDGEVYNAGTDRWRNVENIAKPPPEPFPAGTDTQMILERLTGKESTSSFKQYFEMLKQQKIADEVELRAAIDDVRKKFNLDTEASTVDDVRHALKEAFRPKVVKSMFEAPDGTKLDPKASHKKMLDITKKLNSADKGTLTEEWVQKTREAAGVKEAPQKVEVKKEDHPALTKDRELDRIEGDTINEIKSTDDYLQPKDKAEIDDQLKLIGTEGATIDVRGKPQIVKKAKLTFTNPDGARKNADYIIEQLEAFDTLSVEVFNNAGESKIFTKADVTGVNAGKLHEFIGKKYKK